ncbi:MAG: hypothetical protein K2H37_06395 [Lachnospiraceae bacterium]|nr:hypothetical protein [Lachnospiraceae bacterium]
MVDADGEENPDNSDTTEGETNPEEGAASDETPGDNDTPVIDPADDVEEDPDVTAPVENEVPADAEDEAGEETTTAPGAGVMEAETTGAFTVSYKIMKGDTEASSAATVAFTNECLGSDNTIQDGKDITFTVTAVGEYVLAETNAVTAKAGETTLTVSEADGTYTITNGSGDDAITANVEITVNVVDKTYTVTAPDDENNVTWKIKESTAEEYGSENTVKVKKDGSVKVQATLEANADPVDVTVNGDAKSLTAENTTAEFTVALADLSPAEDGSYSVTAEYLLKKAAATVTVAGKDVEFGTDFTAKYSVKGEDGAFGAYTDVPATGKIEAFAEDEISFKFTALDKESKARTVKAVYFGEENSTTPVKAEVDDETGETTYTVTVAKPVADSANNIVTVELEETNVITIKKAADAKIAKVEYSIDNGSSYKPALVTADGWKVEAKTNVIFKVTAEVHNKVTYIHKGTEDHKAENCTDMVITPANAVTTDALDATTAGETLTIGTEQITVDYTLTAPESKDVTVTIVDANGSAVAPKVDDADGDEGTENDSEQTRAAEQVTYALNDGETYFIKVTGADQKELALEKIESVLLGSTPLHYIAAKKAFRFTADENATAKAITVAVKEASGYDVTVVMANGLTGDYLATIKADAYQNGATADDKAEADTAAKDITAENGVSYQSVWEGTDFSFELAAKDANNFKVVKVLTSTDSEKWTGLEAAENGKYTLKAVNADTTIQVYTDFDAEKAYGIQFVDAGGNIEKVEADLAGGTNYTALDLGKAHYLKVSDTAAVTFKVTAKDGYTVKKVAYGTADEDILEASSEVYTYKKFSADAKAATITISTEADALAADKFVKFETGENVNLTVTAPAGITPNENGVYTLTKEVKEGTTVKVPEISELAFDLTVPYGYALNDTSFATGAVRSTAEKRVKSEDGQSWIYSYKVVANQLTNAGGEADTIVIGAAEAEQVTLQLAKNSERLEYKVLSQDERFQSLTTSADVPAGSTVILKVESGQTLAVGGTDVTDKLDGSNKYSFVAKLDETTNNTVEIDVQNPAAYKIMYDVDPENAAIYDNLAGKDAVEVKIGNKVHVQLQRADNNTAAEISRYEKTDAAKSTVEVADQTGNKAGQAVITVADADVAVKLYTIDTHDVGNITVETEVLAGTITLAAKDAAGKTLTAKGIKNNATIKLDATSVTTYALTLKEGRNTLNVADYKEALEVVSSDPTVATAEIANGNLVVNTLLDKKGEEKATSEITIVAKGAEDTPLLTFKVEGQTPKLKVKSVNSNNQGINDILVDLAADTGIKTISNAFDLYYEVTVAQKEGSTSTTKKDGVYYLNAKNYDAKGKIAPVSQLFKVNADAADKAVENTYTFTVRLVALEAGTEVVPGNPQEGSVGTALAAGSVKFASETNMSKEFKTRPAYYEDKLGVTKKTTKFYSGQQNVVVAVPKFSKKAGYINDIQAVVYNKDGSRAVGVTAADVDLDTMEVKVSAGERTAGTYDVVIYATAQTDTVQNVTDYSMYRASAKVPITVQKGINEILVDYPSQIAMVANNKGVKKDVSVTLKATGIYDSSDAKKGKAQTQKFTYELRTEDLGNPKNADKVVVKNNKITIKKDFIIGSDPDDNAFTVRVKAADYAENAEYTDVTITVNGEALEIGSVKLVDDNGKELPQTITTRDLKGVTVALTDKNGQEIDPSLVTLTPNKGKIYIANDESGAYVVADGYQKNLTVKAVTKDGGKKSASSVKYTINYPERVTYDISNLNLSDDHSAFHRTGDRSYTYMGKGNDSINFKVMAAVGEEQESATTVKYNYSVKVAGGKVTSDKDAIAYGSYYITPNKDTVTVTITDKTIKGDKGIIYTFKDNNWQTAAAPKASTKDKLYVAKDGVSGKFITQSLRYTMAKNNGYDAVKLTRVSGYNVQKWTNENANSYSTYSGIEEIDSNNTFTIDGIFGSSAGTTKYSVVYGNMIGGMFYPKTKAATLSIKVNKTGTVKAVAKYTINPNVAMGVKLEAKPVPVAGMVQFNKVVSANVSGKANQFYDYFEVKDGMLQIKDAKRSADGLAALAALGKNDLTGYLEYQFSNASGNIITKQDKITVTISDKALPKYTATPISIVATDKASAKTTVKLGNDSVNIAKVAAGAGASAGWTASATGDDAENGIVTLTATGTPTAGNVDLYVIPVGSKNAGVTNTEDIRAFGVKVTVKVTTKTADDTKSKLSFAKGSVTPVASINGSKVDLTVVLTEGKDFTYNLSNEAVTAAAKTNAEEITNANDKKAAEAVNSVTFVKGTGGAKDTITFVLDRDKLDGNKAYKVPADLTFTSTTKATVTFSVKTEKVPTMADIEKLVGDALNNFAVTKANYNNATAAAGEVEAAAKKIEIPALSGIQVSAVAAVDADKFGDSGSGETAVAGDHKIKVTLTDVTKAADAEGKTADVEIVVTEKAAEKTVAGALRAVIVNYAVADASGKVPGGKVAVPTTKYALQAALQAAVDSVEANKYIVKVTAFNEKREPATTPGTASVLANETAEGTLTEISYKYEVKDAMTGIAVEGVGSSSTVTTTGATTDIPGEEVTPNPPAEVTVKSVAVTADKEEASKGETVTFTAVVTGSDGNTMTDIDKEKVNWSVTGGSDTENTKIVKDTDNPLKATLTLGANETGGDAKQLTVKVTVDGKESNAVMVTVKAEETTEPEPEA